MSKLVKKTVREMAIQAVKESNKAKMTMAFFRELGFSEDVVGQAVQADILEEEEKIARKLKEEE